MLYFKHRFACWIVALLVPLTSFGSFTVRHLHDVDASLPAHAGHSHSHQSHGHSHSHRHESPHADQELLTSVLSHRHVYLWGIEFGLPEEDSADAEGDSDWIAASRMDFHSWNVDATESWSRPTSELIGKVRFDLMPVSQLPERTPSRAALPLRADNTVGTLSFVVCHDSPGVLLI